MVGASVNGRIVTFDHKLQNGDIVEVRTSKSAPGPSRDWLQLAKSSSARTKIKQWFKKERREENIQRGRDMFDAELRRSGLTMSDVTDEDVLPQILKKLSVPSLDELFAAIGYGGQTAVRSVNRVKGRACAYTQAGEKDRPRQDNRAGRKAHGPPAEGRPRHTCRGPGQLPHQIFQVLYAGTWRRHNRVHNPRQRREHTPHRLPELSAPARAKRERRPLDPRRLGGAHDGFVPDHAAHNQRGARRLRHGYRNRAQRSERQGPQLSARDLGEQSIAVVTVEVRDLTELKGIMNRLQGIRGVSEVRRASS